MDHERFVLGIGNPGSEYDGTRHNVGFMVLDRVAERRGLTFRRLERRGQDGRKLYSGKVKAFVADGIAGEDASTFALVKPTTYVNLSGDVAGALLRVAERPPTQLFVILDDLNLPLGRLRIRPAGSSGGHNGLKSIEAAVGTRDYPRLRLGIGEPDDSAATGADYVLARFRSEEHDVLSPVLDRAADIVEAWISGASIESLMGVHNGFDARDVSAADGTSENESLEQDL